MWRACVLPGAADKYITEPSFLLAYHQLKLFGLEKILST